ncbi:MAG: 1,2-phenylacetyl-CoA epoxidase subunit PaaC [Armatimonadota bacterium]|nr:1,2-phenylacetyl-CoA epoxidase subunit PaaC [Armatimonadota bacterium]MDR7487053.1 1,2-phenylacetyl-CoA epoxidase subunit PaaC [Armatimonadota bacterium]MDR7532392.1 1,2-phenylacetyl-CoA epoxidase subunit PaaC [Armatimonadota bacterium]MDR7535319.1 1,2-phenylacetyl-CoA epoxidase subunit PaaC [Armatimonadota bacterium]
MRDDAIRAALSAVLLAWADDELVLGHRHSEWTGFAPDIESDVALSSIAQEELGHARVFYEQVAAATGSTPDVLAFDRGPEAFRNAVLTEHPNGDWGFTIVRAWLYDRADAIRLADLAAAPLGPFAALARALQREEKYHLLFSEAWLVRLTRAGDDAHSRVQAALDAAWPGALGLFEDTPEQTRLVAEGLLPAAPAAQRGRFEAEVRPRLDALGLGASPSDAATGGRRGHHTPALRALLHEMTSVWRTDPTARW